VGEKYRGKFVGLKMEGTPLLFLCRYMRERGNPLTPLKGIKL
jgi:hypothetical protein